LGIHSRAAGPTILVVDDDPALRRLLRRELTAAGYQVRDLAIADALNSGADDYVLKPFGTKELLARVNNALRRRARELGRVARVVTGGLEIDLLRRRVRVGGSDVHLPPPKVYEVLRILAEARLLPTIGLLRRSGASAATIVDTSATRFGIFGLGSKRRPVVPTIF